jgi:hypothetical protein
LCPNEQKKEKKNKINRSPFIKNMSKTYEECIKYEKKGSKERN